MYSEFTVKKSDRERYKNGKRDGEGDGYTNGNNLLGKRITLKCHTFTEF
jgi:hypothetical protein